MTLPFTKMHGLSNDFVVINNLDRKFHFTSQLIQHMSHRKQGIGFDQLLVLEPASHQSANYDYRIFNNDGHEVEHCANGARCIALYIREKNLLKKDSVCLNIKDRLLHVTVDGNNVTVNMGKPQINPQNIYYSEKCDSLEQTIELCGIKIPFYLISMGNPHAVILSSLQDNYDLQKLGELMNQGDYFPKGINVSIAIIHTPEKISLRVFERGAGITDACGTAACAAMAIGKYLKKLQPTIVAYQTGGPLSISWKNTEEDLMMSGSAVHVFDGHWTS
tara:strand:- start:225 stop:1052 length:828 start_codon:yes stop_codon:yes gene_type:complete